MMARAALLLASEPAEKVNGRVTYSQQILQEFGWIEKASGAAWTRLARATHRSEASGPAGCHVLSCSPCGWTHGQSRPSGARRADRALPAVADHGACRLRLRCAWLEPGGQRSRPAGYVCSRCSLGCLGYRGPAGGACRTLRTTRRSGRGEGDPQSVPKGIDPPESRSEPPEERDKALLYDMLDAGRLWRMWQGRSVDELLADRQLAVGDRPADPTSVRRPVACPMSQRMAMPKSIGVASWACAMSSCRLRQGRLCAALACHPARPAPTDRRVGENWPLMAARGACHGCG